MNKRSTPSPLGIIAVAALATSGTFLAGLSGRALAAEPATGHVASGASLLEARSRDGWYLFGRAATIVAREEIPDDKVTLATLSNGVRLVLKPTDLVDDEILVSVSIDGGYQSLAPGQRAAADLATNMFVRAGVGLKTYEALVATFGPVVTSIDFNTWSNQFNFQAKAKPTELRSLLEILTAYMSDPGWQFNGFDAAKAQAVQYAATVRSNPYVAFQTQSAGLLTSGDPRYIQPSAAQYRDVGERDLRRAIEDRFKSGAIEIAIVGDIDAEETLAMSAATFGTLPVRTNATPEQSVTRFPAHTTTPLEITFDGYPDQQGRMVAWPAPPGLFKSKEEQVISAMFGVMVYRLMDLPAYKTGGFNKGLSAHTGYMSISVVGRREDVGTFYADVARIAAEIAAHGVTQEEIDRAQAPLVRDSREMPSKVPNLYWLVAAMNLKGDRANWEKARSGLVYVEGVTPEEVQSAAARYLHEDKSVSIVANPAKAPESRR